MNMIFLVDGDNNIGTGLKGVDQLTPEDSVLIFYQKMGLALSKIKELCRGSRAKLQYLESVKGGKNSIDFQIITELGVLVGRGEADCAYVISQDKGYEAAMSALRARYAGSFREVGLRPSIASCLRASYLLRAADTQALRTSLEREFGPAQGAAAYQHLWELFAHQLEAEAAAPAEALPARVDESTAETDREPKTAPAKPAAEKAKTAPNGKSAESAETDAAQKPAEAPEEARSASVEELPAGTETEKPAKTGRGGRRRGGKSGAKRTEAAAPAEALPARVDESTAETDREPKTAPAKPAAEKAKTAPNGKSAESAETDAAQKPAEAPEEARSASVEELPAGTETEKPTRAGRGHRGGRRRKKPAAEKDAEE